MAQEKRHLTTEQLSILLDGEVTAEEQAQWEAHVSTCAQCQQELVGLRQTVTLLHALPQPALPRSFLLPLEVATPVASSQDAPAASTAREPIAMRRRAQQRRTLNPYVRGVLRTMSALAAIIGIVFFLSGALSSLTPGGVATSSTASSAYGNVSSGDSAANPNVETPSRTVHPAAPPAATKMASVQGTAEATPTQVVKPQPSGDQTNSGVPQDTGSAGPTILIFNLSSPAGRLGLGMALVILGIMGFVLFRKTRRA